MSVRKVWLTASVIAAGMALQSHGASAQAISHEYVGRCFYYSSDRQYVTDLFVVQDSNIRALEDTWFAWLKDNRQPGGDKRGVQCPTAYAPNLEKVQNELAINPRQTFENTKWIPSFGVPYTLPSEFYYYCVIAKTRDHEFVSDLFKSDTSKGISQIFQRARDAHARATYDQRWNAFPDLRNASEHMSCTVAGPEPFEAYTRDLDSKFGPGQPLTVARSQWGGIDPVAAPNLIDDAEARARFAKMRIGAATGPKPPSAPVAPKPEPAPMPASTPSAGLIIKQDTSGADFKKAFDAKVKKDLADQAQKRAEAAAKAAQADVQQRARIEALIKERRRRGNAQ